MAKKPKIDDGGPAFPGRYVDKYGDVIPVAGMTLRDWLAGQAAVGLLANVSAPRARSDLVTAVALGSYAIADAMLAARKEA